MSNQDGSYEPVNAPGPLQTEDSGSVSEKSSLYFESENVLHRMPNSLRSRFGSVQDVDLLAQFRTFVRKAGDIYLGSLPGKSNIYSNMELAARINNVQGSISMTYEQLNAVLIQIEYRMSLMEQANRLAIYLGLERPRCQMTDMEAWVRKTLGNSRNAYEYARQEIVTKTILGKPSAQQGREFLKPAMYLAACMSDWAKDRIDHAISLLVKVYEQ